MSSRVCNNCGMQVSENARFCSGCGCELLHEPVISSKAHNPSGVIKRAKKGFGIGAKIGLGIGVIFFLILIVGAIVGSSNTSITTGSNINNQQPTTLQEQSSSSNDSSSQDTITNDEIISKVEGHQAITASNTGSTQSSASGISTSEQQAVDFVQHYKGSNGNGLSILQVVSYIVNIDYAGENIANNPSSSIGWIGLVHYDPNSSNVWEVDFDLETYRENTSVKWIVNMNTHTIYPLNNAAKNILDMVNLPSNTVDNNTLSHVHLT